LSDEKVDAWMPLWIGAYLADTMNLSRDSHGGYLLLLFAYWRNKGPLVDDDEDLANIVKATAPGEWKKLRPRLAKFFTIEDGVWRHKRADEELAKAGVHKAAATTRGKAGAAAKWEKERARRAAAAAFAKQCNEDASSNAQAALVQYPTPPPSPVVGEAIASPPTGSGATHTADGEYIGEGEPLPGIAYGAVAGAIRRAGLASIDPGYPAFRALVDAGATQDEFIAYVPEALTKSKPAQWLIAAVQGERERAAGMAARLHRGPMPNKQEAIEQRNRAVGDEWLAEQEAIDASR
jgi:uncharacterized protein YdaU (DUF1376 family)